MKISVEAKTRAPVITAFDVCTDIRAWPQFMSKIMQVEFVAGNSFTAGARFRETRHMHGRKATEEMTIASVTPPTQFVLTAAGHGARYRATTDIEDIHEGTLIRLTFEGTPTTLLAKLLTPMMLMFRGALRRQLQADLADLVKEADRRAEPRG
jgi:hypothetical protein